MESKKRNYIHSLEKGLAMLALFSKVGPQVSLKELAEAANVSLGNATRYVQTFLDLGYLLKDPETRKYRLAPKILSLGFSLIKDMDLRARVTPYLAEINRELGIGAQCAILDETEIVYVERYRAQTLVSLDLTIGSRIPAYCTSLGRAILAYLDEESLNRIEAKIAYVQHTPYTISNRADLLNELEKTRKRGYSINLQELVLGQSGLAVPIFNGGVVEGACGFSFPHEKMEDAQFKEEIISRMLEIARIVSIN